MTEDGVLTGIFARLVAARGSARIFSAPHGRNVLSFLVPVKKVYAVKRLSTLWEVAYKRVILSVILLVAPTASVKKIH